jgi:hypothetical protein
LAFWKIINEEGGCRLDPKIWIRELFQRIFALRIFLGGVSRCVATPLTVALSPVSRCVATPLAVALSPVSRCVATPLSVALSPVSRCVATPLTVALSPGHSDVTRFRPWSPIATGNNLDHAKRKKFQKLLRRLAPLTFLFLVKVFRDPLHGELPHVQIFVNQELT